jgi:hypothetical protein
MSKRTRQRLSFEAAAAELPAVRERVGRLAAEHAALAQRIARVGAELKLVRMREGQLQRIVDRGPPTREAIMRVAVENPLRADGQVEAELAGGGPVSAFVEVDVRLATRIGGLARIKGLTDVQLQAAARFRSIWEQAQLGGARAIDYERVRVDTSGGGQAAVLASGEAARQEYSRLVQALGMIRSNLVQRVVCEEMSVRQLGAVLGRGGGKSRLALAGEVLDVVDDLARLLHVGPAQPRPRIRGSGARAGDWSADGDQSSGARSDEAA